jgi:nucleotide-binding universal stress UspA family protein
VTRYLLATTSVHTTAAAADYLESRLAADDEVSVLTVAESEMADRDAGDAANVARSRLLPATVEILTRDGDPVDGIRSALTGRDVDELVVGTRRPDTAGDDSDSVPGSTVQSLLGTVDVPVVVLPPVVLSSSHSHGYS